MNSYMVLKYLKYKSESGIYKCQRHNERQSEMLDNNLTVRRNLSDKNYYLKEPHCSYASMVKEKIEVQKITPRINSVLMVGGIIGATSKFLENMTYEEQKEFFKYAYNFLKQRFGEGNILSAIVHMDENTPHMHFAAVPINSKGHLSAKSILGGEKEGEDYIYKDFCVYMKCRYKDISIPNFKRKGRGSFTYPQIFNRCPDEITKLNEIRVLRNDFSPFYLNRFKDPVMKLTTEIAVIADKKDNEIRETEKYIKDASLSLQSIERETEIIRSRAKEAEADFEKLELKTEFLEKEISGIVAILKGIPSETRNKYIAEDKNFATSKSEVRRQKVTENTYRVLGSKEN